MVPLPQFDVRTAIKEFLLGLWRLLMFVYACSWLALMLAPIEKMPGWLLAVWIVPGVISVAYMLGKRPS